MLETDSQKYDDIIDMPRPVSAKHAPMSMLDRAAQFSSFAALVGYGDVIRESARQTAAETFLDEHGKELLDRKLQYIGEHMEIAGEVSILYYAQDARKSGGQYLRATGNVKKLDTYRKRLVMEDGREIEIENIRAIEGVE